MRAATIDYQTFYSLNATLAAQGYPISGGHVLSLGGSTQDVAQAIAFAVKATEAGHEGVNVCDTTPGQRYRAVVIMARLH